VQRVLGGDAEGLEPTLAAHQATLEDQMRKLADTAEKVRGARAALASGRAPATGELTHLLKPASKFGVVFDLPWPWEANGSNCTISGD
jgi:hypothetical protein